MYPGAHVLVKIDDDPLTQKKVPAKVVWCKELKNANKFRYGVGVEFLQVEKIYGLKAFFPIPPQMKTPSKNKGGVSVQLEKR